METDFHMKSRLSLAGWGSLWYENRANPSSSGCCHVFIFPTRCPFINLWLALALCLKRLVLNWLILDCCCCSSEKTRSVSHRSFKVLNSTTVTLCNLQLPAGLVCTPLHPLWQGNKLLNSHNMNAVCNDPDWIHNVKFLGYPFYCVLLITLFPITPCQQLFVVLLAVYAAQIWWLQPFSSKFRHHLCVCVWMSG